MQHDDDFLRELAGLSPEDRARIHDYVAFLRWRASGPVDQEVQKAPPRAWRFNFLEHFEAADVRASDPARLGSSPNPAGMEVLVAEAVVGGARRPALWQHPPIIGEALVEFHVPVPARLRDLRLRFAIGIRDGAGAAERLVAFRVKVDGWQVWSRAAYPRSWEAYEIGLPFQSGNILRIAFATDGLGDHQWSWAAWAEPELVGEDGG